MSCVWHMRLQWNIVQLQKLGKVLIFHTATVCHSRMCQMKLVWIILKTLKQSKWLWSTHHSLKLWYYQFWYDIGSLSKTFNHFPTDWSAGSGHGPLRSSLKKPKQRDIASVSSRSSSKQVRISLGSEQTTVWAERLPPPELAAVSALKLYLQWISRVVANKNIYSAASRVRTNKVTR